MARLDTTILSQPSTLLSGNLDNVAKVPRDSESPAAETVRVRGFEIIHGGVSKFELKFKTKMYSCV